MLCLQPCVSLRLLLLQFCCHRSCARCVCSLAPSWEPRSSGWVSNLPSSCCGTLKPLLRLLGVSCIQGADTVPSRVGERGAPARALLVDYVPVCVPVAVCNAARLWSTGLELTLAGACCDPIGICRAQRLTLLVGGCRESGSAGRRLCLCQGCPFLLRAALQAQNPSQSSGGTAVLSEEMPLQMETNNLKGWRILPERGRRWRGIVLKHRPSLVLPCPFLILASPGRVSAGKAPAVLQN